ncbi:tetratricopeptide repeat protein [Parapedobacter indicus]|uniref:Tetratricopeptide repeat-containing protein n=1 Tax=Parapedobacter indicus TaxID=1477437 RepID=A0A1I3D848_9SPHI|nr:tetratricopeptide repeat protein [Parapedobacter indicus]PPL04561.1 tetratricopeptide repeat protein [Parapedobacter indicus]SFH82779.1 Tetratricopeptide repeat-containing protein [Parapedobacter indicus]
MITQESIGYKYLLTGAFSVLLAVGYAQEEKGQVEPEQQEQQRPSEQHGEREPITIDSIDVVRDYRPMLADAVKIRRSPDMRINRQALETELRRIAATTYFAKNAFKKPYYGRLLERHREATPSNIDNYRIGYLAYENGEYERATAFFEKLERSDAFYQSSVIALGNISLKAGDKEAARNAFVKASELDFDRALKVDGLFNYAKILFELDSPQVALEVAREYVTQEPKSTVAANAEKTETPETLLAEILLGTSNFEAAVNMLETFSNRDREADMIYQKVAYYRGLEFYNERAFENSISLFMRSEEFSIDPRIAALATYWKAEAMYEVRKYGEAVQNFSRFMRMPAAPETDVYSYANYALAYAAFRSNSFKVAANYFERFLATDESSMEENVRNDAIARLGDSYLSLRDYGRANQHYDRLINGKAPNQDYALFQRGIIQGLEGDNQTKMSTLRSVIEQFPNSNYADDVAFEIPYTYFTMGDYDTAIEGLQAMIDKYPRSSYAPRALMTIGLVQYNKEDNEAAMATFRRVVEEHSTTDEARQALRSIENMYLDGGDASGYVNYATNSNLGDLSKAEQDNLAFRAAQTLFARGQYQAAVEAINAYFDKFPNPIQEKHARYIRGVSLYRTGHPKEALHDLNIILNDWTSQYTENTLLAVADLYLGLEQYNEAIVHLKKLELTSEYKASYGYAVTNLLVCYYKIGDMEQVLKYAKLIKAYDRSGEEDIAKAHLYTGYVLLQKGNSTEAAKEMNLAALKSQTVTGAEAQYNVAQLHYKAKRYDKAIESAFDVINNRSSYDYWVAKSFIVLADAYAGKGDAFQAKSTLESIIANYEGEDDIIPSAKRHLQKLN